MEMWFGREMDHDPEVRSNREGKEISTERNAWEKKYTTTGLESKMD